MAFEDAQLDADILHMLDDLPVELWFGGRAVTATRTTLRRDDVLADEGLYNVYRFSVYVRTADFRTPPEPSETVEIDGTTYYVLRREDAAAGRLTRYDLGERYPGAYIPGRFG